jgi:hypothetical protein
MSDECDSLDAVFVHDEGPGDTTPKPCPPHLLPYLLKERKLLEDAGLLPPLASDNRPPAADPGQ